MTTLAVTHLSIDWISVTSKRDVFDGYTAHPSLHDWENWDYCTGVNGYTSGSKHATGVRTYSNENREDMGKHTVYSGSALKRVEEYSGCDPYEILRYHDGVRDNFSRVDFAVDFINKNVSVKDFEDELMAGRVSTRIKTVTKTESLSGDGYTLYLGSMKSKKKLVRVYNKASEQGMSGDWVRVETQIMGKPATEAVRLLCGASDVGGTFVGICNDVADWSSVGVWEELSENAKDAHIGSVSSEKGDTRQWLVNQCIPALAREVMLDSGFWVKFMGEFAVKLKEMGYKGDVG